MSLSHLSALLCVLVPMGLMTACLFELLQYITSKFISDSKKVLWPLYRYLGYFPTLPILGEVFDEKHGRDVSCE